MTFVITVKADVAGPQAAAEKLVRTLEAGEDAGRRSGAGIAQGARAGASALERSRAAAEATGSSLAQLMGGLGRTGLAFDSLTSAIAREQAMLDRINGPSRKYEQHLQTLDSLLAKDRISTEQYAEQVKKLNRELERGSTIRTPPAAPGGGGGGLLGGLGSMASGALGGAGLKDALSTAAGVELAAVVQHVTGEVLHLANAYGEIHNRLAAVSGSQAQLNGLMAETFDVAQATRGEWDEVAGAYQRIAKATEHLGTTQSEVMALTTEISQGLALSGANAQETRMTMAELTHAFELGALTGREFKVVLKDATPIVGELAKALGIGRAEFIEMGKHGKLTADLLMEGFRKAGPSIQEQFAKLTPTLNQSWTQLENSSKKFFGSLAESLGIFTTANTAVSVFGTALTSLSDVVGLLKRGIDGVFGSIPGVGDVMGEAVSPVLLLTAAFYGLTAPITLLVAALPVIKKLFDEAAVWGQALGEALVDSADLRAARSYLAEMEALEKLGHQLERVEQAERDLTIARAAGLEIKSFDVDGAKRAAEVAMQMKLVFGVDLPAAYDESTKRAMSLSAEVEKLREKHALDEQTEQAKKLEQAMRGVNGVIEEHAKHWQGVREKLGDVNQALAKIAQDRADLARVTGKDPLIEMFGKGRQDALDVTREELALKREQRDLTDSLANSEYAYGATVERIHKATAEHKDDLEGVNAAYRDGRITLKEYTDELKKLGVEEDRATKLLREIRKPGLEYSLDVKALNLLLAQGRIAFFEYENAMRKVTDAYAGSELRQLLEGALAPKAPKMVSTSEGDVTRAAFEGMQKYQDAVDKATADAEVEYARPVFPDLEKDLAAFDAAGASMKQMLDSIKGPTREYNLGLADTKQLLADGLITSKEYETQIRKLEEAYFGATHAGKSFEDGLARGLHGIRNEITDVGSQIETTLKNAFKGAEDALVQFVTTGKVDFKSLINSMLGDLTRLIERQILAGLIGGGGPGGNSAAASAATAISASAAAAASAAVASAAAAAAAANAALGMVGGAVGGAAGAASGGGAGGVEAAIGLIGSIFGNGAPQLARGGSMTVAGSPGIDTNLLTAWVSNGETVTVTPQGQAQQAAPQRPVTVVNVYDRSEMRSFMEGEGEGFVLNVMRRNETARRGRMTGR